MACAIRQLTHQQWTESDIDNGIESHVQPTMFSKVMQLLTMGIERGGVACPQAALNSITQFLLWYGNSPANSPLQRRRSVLIAAYAPCPHYGLCSCIMWDDLSFYASCWNIVLDYATWQRSWKHHYTTTRYITLLKYGSFPFEYDNNIIITIINVVVKLQ